MEFQKYLDKEVSPNSQIPCYVSQDFIHQRKEVLLILILCNWQICIDKLHLAIKSKEKKKIVAY